MTRLAPPLAHELGRRLLSLELPLAHLDRVLLNNSHIGLQLVHADRPVELGVAPRTLLLVQVSVTAGQRLVLLVL